MCAGGVLAHNKGYNFALDLNSIEGLHMKIWPSKLPEVSILEILGILGLLGQNDIWMQPLWLIIKNNIRGKVVASFKFKLW
jgi:hypothetical protein